jgi:hypothetical protein
MVEEVEDTDCRGIVEDESGVLQGCALVQGHIGSLRVTEDTGNETELGSDPLGMGAVEQDYAKKLRHMSWVTQALKTLRTCLKLQNDRDSEAAHTWSPERRRKNSDCQHHNETVLVLFRAAKRRISKQRRLGQGLPTYGMDSRQAMRFGLLT